MAQAAWGSPNALLALFTAVLLLLHALPQHVHGHGAGHEHGGATLDIVKMLLKSRKFDSVTHLFHVAGLTEMLETTNGPLTFFLPTDIYYDRNIDDRLLKWLLQIENKDSLRKVLLFHITQEKYIFLNFTTPPLSFPSLEGSTLHVRLAMKNKLERLVIEESPLKRTDTLLAKDGAVHGIDGFLVPPSVVPLVLCPVLAMCEGPEPAPSPTSTSPSPGPGPGPGHGPGPAPLRLTVVEALIAAKYTELATALIQTGLDKLVNSATGITILAPSNNAFSLFLSSLTPAEIAQLPKVLKWILLYHVLPAYYAIEDLRSLSSSPSFYKRSGVTFSSNSQTLIINPNTSAAELTTPNILLNGDASVQGIDKVLVPLGLFTEGLPGAPAPSPLSAPTPAPEEAPPTAAGTHLTAGCGMLLASIISLTLLL